MKISLRRTSRRNLKDLRFVVTVSRSDSDSQGKSEIPPRLYMTDERRQNKRVPLLVEVMWEAKAGNYEARTSDLSTGGCFVDTIGKVSNGEHIIFKLQLPDGEWMELQGNVTYAYPNVGFGVRFTNLSDANKKTLEKLVGADHG